MTLFSDTKKIDFVFCACVTTKGKGALKNSLFKSFKIL